MAILYMNKQLSQHLTNPAMMPLTRIIKTSWLHGKINRPGQIMAADFWAGLLELETSQGERWICRPGDILFTEDFDGRGHITRSLRDIRGFFHVVMPDDFKITDWPLVQK